MTVILFHYIRIILNITNWRIIYNFLHQIKTKLRTHTILAFYLKFAV